MKTTMARSRYQIQAEVRRVFVRHWVDLDRIKFGVHRGALRVTGELHLTRREGTDSGLSIIDVLRAELIRNRDITRVHFDLTNWQRDKTGAWRQTASKAVRSAASTSAGSGTSFELNSDDSSSGNKRDD